MYISYVEVILPVIGVMVNIVTQIFSFRFSSIGLLKSIFLGFITGFAGIIILEYYVFGSDYKPAQDFIAIFITFLFTYSSLCYCYFHFLNLGETARRIRILRELYKNKEGLSIHEILERYNAIVIVEKRINRLINNGQIVCRNGRYYIDSHVMLLMAKIIVMLKLIILGKREIDYIL